MTAQTPYGAMGGEQAILNLVDRFYFYMDTLPEAGGIRATNLSAAKEKLFKPTKCRLLSVKQDGIYA